MDFGDILKALVKKDNFPNLADAVRRRLDIPDIDLDGSEEKKSKTLMVVREIARALIDNSNHFEATSLLQTMEDNSDDIDLSTKLSMAECYLTLGKEVKAKGCTEEVRKFLLSDPKPPAAEVLDMAESMIEAKLYLRALILIPVASELFDCTSDSDNAIEGMFRCIDKADDCTRPMLREGGRDRVLGVDYGLEFMESCLKRILANKNADPQKIAFKHGIIGGWISYIYWILDDNAKGIAVRQTAVNHLEKAFGPSANQRRVYATLLYNMGVGYTILNKNDKAREAFVKAIDAAEHATDFDDEAARQKELQSYRQKLRELK